MKTTLNLNIGDDRWQKLLPDAKDISEKVLAKVIEVVTPSFLQNKNEVLLNLELGNDTEIRELNSRFRNLDKPTNVLSFANIDDDDFVDALPDMKEVELGDIIIAAETMEEQSREQEIDFCDHYVHILVHGILHLLGYDHMEPDDKAEMRKEEEFILHRLGYVRQGEEL